MISPGPSVISICLKYEFYVFIYLFEMHVTGSLSTCGFTLVPRAGVVFACVSYVDITVYQPSKRSLVSSLLLRQSDHTRHTQNGRQTMLTLLCK